MGKLQDKVAIVTGGARGIGGAATELFVEEGAKVVIWDLLEAEGTALKERLTEAGHTVEFDAVNVADPAQIQAAVDRIFAAWGRIDILINNAGIIRDASFLKMSHEQFDQVIAVNLKGVFNATKAVAPIMKAQQYGRIVSISSIVALYGNFGQTNYVAAKAGVIGMTKVWARELGKYGITANAIAPGFIKTDMTDSLPEEILAQAANAIPTKRLGDPMDIAQGLLYLASDAAGFVNGHCLSIDGGAVS
ncbi:MAG: 3-oxoacyl-ACP reductase FabG [Bacteroidota bacterium]